MNPLYKISAVALIIVIAYVLFSMREVPSFKLWRWYFFLLVAFAIATTLSGCATTEESAQYVGSMAKSAAPQVEFPVLSQIGIAPRGQNVAIVNGTPFYGCAVAYGTKLGCMAPGDEVVAARRYEPLYQQTPVAVIFFRDRAMTQYAGTANRVFGFSSGQSMSFSWTIRAGDVQTPEGIGSAGAIGINYPSPSSKADAKETKLPREWHNGTTAIQVVNNTLFRVAVRIDGRGGIFIPPGAFLYATAKTVLGQTGPVSMQFVFADQNDRLVGTYDQAVWAASSGVIAQQIVLSPWMIRR